MLEEAMCVQRHARDRGLFVMQTPVSAAATSPHEVLVNFWVEFWSGKGMEQNSM